MVAKAGWHNAWWLLLTALTVVVDQITKLWTLATFPAVNGSGYYDEIVVTSFFTITRRHNTGAAFSFLADSGGWQHYFFVGVAALVTIWIVWWLWKNPRAMRWQAVAFCLILGGAIGNTIDRVSYGYVVDFLLFHYNSWSWPAFNVADMAITGGVILMLWDSFFGKHEEPQ